jgi:UDP-N-acetyl-D-mannosaminouronate:lipid I N-acetyl-D-mannosaminouronosyltransferase
MLGIVNGINVNLFKDADEMLEHLEYIDKKILIAINALKVVNADDSMKRIVNNNIGYADGDGVIFALKWKGNKNIAKIPGCELWLKIIEKYHDTKSFYLLGSSQKIIEKTVKKLNEEYPNINIKNFFNGYFNSEEKEIIIQDILEKKPDVIFIAMGSPKQELLMEELYSFYPALYQGLGGSFDVYVDNVQRAPQWLIDRNLEWAYRLFKQPSRLIRQFSLVKFMFRVITGIY